MISECEITETDCESDYLYHKCSSEDGESGSPLWTEDYYIRGVHNVQWNDPITGNYVYNSGIAITSKHFESIIYWLKL
jgi:V8-like Glu-specific endopeptidase